MTPRLAQLLETVRHARRVARLEPFDASTEAGRSDERYRRIVLGTAAGVVGRATSILVGLVTVPLVIGHLGKEQYGLWSALGALAGWIALFDLGLPAGLLNATSEANGRDDRAAARAALSTALLALGAIAGVLLVLGLVALPWIPWRALLETSPEARDLVPAGAAVALGMAVVGLPLGAAGQALAGYQRAHVGLLSASLGSLLSLGALVVAVGRGGTLPVIMAATSCAALVGGLLNLAYLTRRELPWLRPGLRWASVAALRRLAASALPIYLLQLGGLLVNQSQLLILARRAGLSGTAEYDLVWKVYVLIVGLVVLGTSSVGPSLREAYERGELRWMRRAFWHLVRLRMGLAAAAIAALLAAGDLAIGLWLHRPDFRYGPAGWALVGLMIALAVWVASFAELLTVLDRVWPQVSLVAAQGLVTATLTWFAAPHGTNATLVAFALPGLASAVFYPQAARRFLLERPA